MNKPFRICERVSNQVPEYKTANNVVRVTNARRIFILRVMKFDLKKIYESFSKILQIVS